MIVDRLASEQMTARILNGGMNMAAFGAILTSEEISLLLAFLESRNINNPAVREAARN